MDIDNLPNATSDQEVYETILHLIEFEGYTVQEICDNIGITTDDLPNTPEIQELLRN